MRTKAIIRLVATVILTVNAFLTVKGINPIPFDETAVTEVVSEVLAGISIFWSWWKNAPITKEALDAQSFLIGLKGRMK